MNNTALYKRTHGWTNLKKIETDCNFGFWKLVSLTVFQRSFFLSVTFDIMFGGQICLTWSALIMSFACYFLAYTYFHWGQGRVIGNVNKWSRQSWHRPSLRGQSGYCCCCFYLLKGGRGGGGGNAVELRMGEIRVEEEPVSPPITDT